MNTRAPLPVEHSVWVYLMTVEVLVTSNNWKQQQLFQTVITKLIALTHVILRTVLDGSDISTSDVFRGDWVP